MPDLSWATCVRVSQNRRPRREGQWSSRLPRRQDHSAERGAWCLRPGGKEAAGWALESRIPRSQAAPTASAFRGLCHVSLPDPVKLLVASSRVPAEKTEAGRGKVMCPMSHMTCGFGSTFHTFDHHTLSLGVLPLEESSSTPTGRKGGPGG